MANQAVEQPQYVYFVTNEEGTANVEANSLQPQIVFTTEGLASVVETERESRSIVVEDPYENPESSADIWSKCNNALRDLLVYLVKKYHIEDVMDSKMKALQWEKLMTEFYAFIGDQNLVSKPQIQRKWHNWKQYNKGKKKPHPFQIVGDLNAEIVREKCQRLLEKLESEMAQPEELHLPLYTTDTQPSIATQPLTSNEQLQSAIGEFKVLQPPLGKLNKIRRRDFLIRRTGASVSALSAKRLEHELTLESLSYEQARWKLKAENQEWIKEKLTKKITINRCEIRDC